MKSMIYPFGDKDAFLNGALLMPEAIPQLLKFNIQIGRAWCRERV